MYLHLPAFRRALRITFSRDHFHPGHVAWTVTLTSVYLLLRTVVLACRGLDHIVFPRFRRQPVTAPVYVIGNPRSGTTFFHRLMSLDPRFTTMGLYHTILPSLLLYRITSGALRIDAMMGGPTRKLLRLVSERVFGGWEGIHRTRLSEPEEDEQLFVYAFLTPVLTLLFPYFREMDEMNFVDRLDPTTRRRLMKHYVGSLKRHLHSERTAKTLLVKNTSIAGRLRATFEAVPTMRIVHLVRHPYDTIPSLLSMYTVTWRRLVPPAVDDNSAARDLAFLFCDYYRYRLEVLDEIPESQIVEVRYEDLVADPAETVRAVYERLGLTMTAEFESNLREASQRAESYRSPHRYSLEDFGLSEDEIRSRLGDAFERHGFGVSGGQAKTTTAPVAH